MTSTLTPPLTKPELTRKDCSNEDYHQDPAISSSHVKLIRESPHLYYSKYLDPKAPKQRSTQAMLQGTIVHSAVLEPESFHQEYLVLSANRTTKIGKAEIKEAEASGRMAITTSEYDLAMAMADAVRAHPAAADLLSQGEAESSWWWTDPETDLRCKVRPDWLNKSGQYLIDLKTCQDATPRGFARAALSLGYHLQQQHYLQAFPDCKFYFIAAEKTYPYQVGVYELDEDARLRGQELWQKLMTKLAKCRATGIWPGLSASIETIELPCDFD